MDVIRSHAAQLPGIDERWTPRPYERPELAEPLLRSGVAGPQVSHDLDNVLRNIRLMCEGDPGKQFGLSGLAGAFTPREVLELVAREAGFEPDHTATHGPVPIDPDNVLDRCEAVGDRLAYACRRRQRLILATGHPIGLAHLYVEVGRELRARGVELIEPSDGVSWRDGDGDRLWRVRYLQSVAMLVDEHAPRHTHGADPMARLLAEERPDLVFADHGWAGAAIESGVETLSIADVNDPALIVARAQGRTDVVIVMDDNVQPDTYWPCFQAIVGRLPGRSARRRRVG